MAVSPEPELTIARCAPQGRQRKQVERGSEASYWPRRTDPTSPRNSLTIWTTKQCAASDEPVAQCLVGAQAGTITHRFPDPYSSSTTSLRVLMSAIGLGLLGTDARDAFVVRRLARRFSFGYAFRNLACIQACSLECRRLDRCLTLPTRAVTTQTH